MGLVQILLPILTSLCLERNCTDESLRHQLETAVKNETFVVTTLQNGPLSGYRNINGSYIGTGVAFEVFNILHKEYGFNYVLKPPQLNAFEGEGGAKEMLKKGEADIVVAFLPEKHGDPEIDYSRPLDIAEWRVLMKRPKESATGSGLLAPFNSKVWSLIIVSLLGVGPVLWLIMLLRARMCKDEEDMVFSLPACMWFVYGALLKQGSTLNPRTDSSRILFSTWWIFITILTAFYTANLTAFLTLSKFTLKISEPKDISRKKYQWITNKGNAIVEYLDPNFNEDFGKTLLEDIGNPMMEVDVITFQESAILTDYVIRRERLYIREQTVLETIMYEDYKEKTKRDVDEADRCTYVITDFPICQFSRSFAFKSNFIYTKLFDFTIQHLRQAGIIEFKHRELLPDAKICPLDLGSKERRLRNSDLAMTYQIVGGGLVISSVVFAIELLIHAFKNHGCWKRENRNRLFRNNNITSINEFDNFFDPKHSHFVTPPPPYHSLFGHPPIVPGSTYKKQTINGREYWVVNDRKGATSLIPQRAPSALLFQFTN